MNIESLYNIFKNHPQVQTDSRKLKQGEIFFALKGDNFNGNLFAAKALENGAAAVVVDEPIGIENNTVFKVDNVLHTLQDLAKHHRQQLSIPVIAITGSNGKTTTKELIHAVLSSHYITYTTEGNLNNHIGIPLTLLKIKPDAEIAVVEMGANHQKEIEGYCRYTLPTHGLITNIGKAHLEGFGGIEGVKKGKGELFDYIRAHKGAVFVFNDQESLRDLSSNLTNKCTYGLSDADITGTIVSTQPFLSVQINHPGIGKINSRLVGDYNYPNILAAAAVGLYFKVPGEQIKKAIEGYIPTNSRSQMIHIGSNEVILDAYNANPSSMQAAINNFAMMPSDKKNLFLGAMAELGEESISEHQKLIDLIQTYKWHQVILVGEEFKKVKHSYLHFNNSEEAAAWLQKNRTENAAFLIKGSRSTKMEKVLEGMDL
jgi:UDP-N-acetylmuramoyl-tripeptide--D-alanyl-D-alanine ligase